jgi:predicted DCC family thiol-disulfide oxidoreductase YuxK
MKPGKALDLIYDGQCGFCVRSLRIVRAVDVFRRIRFHDAHDTRAIETAFPELSGRDLNEAMYAVTAAGMVHVGFFAFRRVMWVTPLLWPLVPLFYLPGSTFMGTRLYAWIARNRYRFGCQSEVCGLLSEPGEGLARPGSLQDQA